MHMNMITNMIMNMFMNINIIIIFNIKIKNIKTECL